MSRIDIAIIALAWINGALVGGILTAAWIRRQVASGKRVARQLPTPEAGAACSRCHGSGCPHCQGD